MKYGAELAQHSARGWEAYNIKYDEIKGEIRKRTTTLAPDAIPIPGHDLPSALDSIETDLCEKFVAQYEFVDGFIRTKYTEIDGRLSDIQKRIALLTRRIQSNANKSTPLTWKKLLDLQRHVHEVRMVIEQLERFIGAQRTAFEKLLKKARRWTKSPDLLENFKRDVLFSPRSFPKQWEQKSPSIRSTYINVEHVVKTLIEAHRDKIPLPSSLRATWGQSNASSPAQSVSRAATLNRICQDESNIVVDAVLANLPLGANAGRAVYLVHTDNLTQITILLIQFSRLLVRRKSREDDSPFSSTGNSRRSSTDASSKGLSTDDSGNNVGLIAIGTLPDFLKQQYPATIGDIENSPGEAAEDSVVSIRYSSQDEAVVTVGVSCGELHGGSSVDERRPVLTAKCKRKSLRKLFNPDASFDFMRKSGQSFSESDTAEQASKIKYEHDQLAQVRQWLLEHKHIEPLVHMRYGRSRFVGTDNDDSCGLWATLDLNITMKRAWYEDLNNLTRFSNFKDDMAVERFPHALLEVRWEGGVVPRMVNVLDKSHLTERIPGFSILTHAVISSCKPAEIPVSPWSSVLEKDIRKVQPPEIDEATLSRRQSIQTEDFPASASTQPTSASEDLSNGEFSAAVMESSSSSIGNQSATLQAALEPPKKQRKMKRRLPPTKQLPNSPQIPQVNWNEYDYGEPEEFGEQYEPYTILVDLEEPGPFATFFNNISSTVDKSTRKVREWLRMYHYPEKKAGGARDPLLQNAGDSSADSSDLEDGLQDSATEDLLPFRRGRGYNTFGEEGQSSRLERYRETLFLRLTAFSFFVSVVLLVVTAVLICIPRKRYVLESQVGGGFGIAMSLVCAIMGLLAMMRCPGRRWTKGITGFVFAVVAIGNVGLGAMIAFE